MTSSFQGMGAYFGNGVNLVGSGEPQRISGAQVTSDVLPLLGVVAARPDSRYRSNDDSMRNLS